LEQEKGNHLRQDEYEKLIKDLMAPKQTFEEEYKKSLQNEKQWRKQCEDLVEKLDAEVF
jgi:predicted  nucleic acid-binding Zn-ribbon protein